MTSWHYLRRRVPGNVRRTLDVQFLQLLLAFVTDPSREPEISNVCEELLESLRPTLRGKRLVKTGVAQALPKIERLAPYLVNWRPSSGIDRLRERILLDLWHWSDFVAKCSSEIHDGLLDVLADLIALRYEPIWEYSADAESCPVPTDNWVYDPTSPRPLQIYTVYSAVARGIAPPETAAVLIVDMLTGMRDKGLSDWRHIVRDVLIEGRLAVA